MLSNKRGFTKTGTNKKTTACIICLLHADDLSHGPNIQGHFSKQEWHSDERLEPM